MSPLVLPALAFGLAALMYFTLLGLPVSPLTLVIAGHLVVVRALRAAHDRRRAAQLEPALLESSASLGAGRALYVPAASRCR